MSFQLIDRIETFTPQKNASGAVQTPPGPSAFPLCLIVEALGQLAGYVAMEAADFQQLPVAAMAGKVSVLEEIRGETNLELSISVRSLRSGAMRYSGVASVNGVHYVEIQRCTGFMLPMEDFDEPERVRSRFEQLRKKTFAPRDFALREQFSCHIETLDHPSPQELHATLQAPLEAAFYQDHFPRRPVYPATLLLDSQISLAQKLLANDDPAYVESIVREVRDVKVRAFTPPGGRISIVAKKLDPTPEETMRRVDLEAFNGETRISSATATIEALQK